MVFTDTEGPGEIILHDRNGWIVPVEDHIALRGVIQSIIDGGLELPSPEICEATTASYRINSVVNRFEEAIRLFLAYRNKSRSSASDNIAASWGFKDTENKENSEGSHKPSSIYPILTLSELKQQLIAYFDAGRINEAEHLVQAAGFDCTR